MSRFLQGYMLGIVIAGSSMGMILLQFEAGIPRRPPADRVLVPIILAVGFALISGIYAYLGTFFSMNYGSNILHDFEDDPPPRWLTLLAGLIAGQLWCVYATCVILLLSFTLFSSRFAFPGSPCFGIVGLVTFVLILPITWASRAASLYLRMYHEQLQREN